MGIFKKFFERRSSPVGVVDGEEFLRQMLKDGCVTLEIAMQIPAYASSVEFVAGMIAGLPIKLYKEDGTNTEEITDDPRVLLLNGYTGDLLFNTSMMVRGMIRDYFNRGAGYAYIERDLNTIKALHYVCAKDVTATVSENPIYHDADIMVGGMKYKPYEFIRILRNTRDGAKGQSVPAQAPVQLMTAYSALKYELQITKTGGNKKGVIQAERKLDKESMEQLKKAWAELYSQDSNNMLILNQGLTFKETSSTSVDLQINQNKITNAAGVAQLFLLSPEVISGKGDKTDIVNAVQTAVMPIITILQDAINDALLLEEEKGSKYFEIDSTELTKGDILKRYQAYRIALEANFLQPDEVRYRENMKPLGMNFVKLGLNDVLYDPKEGTVYTPNTNQAAEIHTGKGGKQSED